MLHTSQTPHADSPTRLPAAYLRLLVAWFCSLTGDGLRVVGLPLLAASVSPTPGAVSLVATATVLPWLLVAIPAGALVDRLSPVRVVVGAHLFRAVATGALAVAVMTGHVSIPVLCLVGFLLTAAETFADGAAQTALVHLVPPTLLERANSRFVMVETVALDLAGPLVAGATFAVARWSPFLLSAALFAVSACVVAGLRVPAATTAPTGDADAMPSAGGSATGRERRRLWQDIGAGLGRLFRDPVLRTLVITVAVMAAATAAQDGVLVIYATDDLLLPSALFPTLLAAYSVGTLLAGLVTGRLDRGRRTGPLMLAAMAGVGGSMLVMGLVVDRWAAWLCYGVMGLAGGTWNVLSAARRQRRTPHAMIARVSSAFRVVAWGFLPVGTLLGGALGTGAGVPAVFVASGAVVLVLGVVVARPLLAGDRAPAAG
ncbi:MFS transporter [Nakamurella endophytica]|uniref:MFS transporter n=1 Tax=Nakamurella endophytica TaxID=1748367 RepID=A0A917T3H2_9ACTN|nr:MFS transporter [Nakamurella endophytica]GGM06925.1 hypothetical protein GCM10011594_28660 [Nakamurella endophytica]